jgi:hypothetical protein
MEQGRTLEAEVVVVAAAEKVCALKDRTKGENLNENVCHGI